MITAQEICSKQQLNKGNEHDKIVKTLNQIEKELKKASVETKNQCLFTDIPYKMKLSSKGLQNVVGTLGKNGYFASPFVPYMGGQYLYINWNPNSTCLVGLPVLYKGMDSVCLPFYTDSSHRKDETVVTQESNIMIPCRYWKEMEQRTQRFNGTVNNFIWMKSNQTITADYHFKTWYGLKGALRINTESVYCLSNHIPVKRLDDATYIQDEINWYTKVIRRIIN